MLQKPNHHRRSIRLKGYDYSQEGLYFITICVQNKECLFGDITVGACPCGCPNDVIRPNDVSHPNDDITCRPNDNITNIVQPHYAPTMQLNDSGVMIEKQWLALPERFPNIQLHEFVVMPDHFHGILEIVPDVGANPCGRPMNGDDGRPMNGDDGRPMDGDDGRPILDGVDISLYGQPQGHAPTVAKRKTVGDMMDAFKSITTVEYIRGVKNLGWAPFNGKLWQRNYYEHIIRDFEAFLRISQYIRENPEKWGGS
jgi:putative transposase